jgi:hypothetical protein
MKLGCTIRFETARKALESVWRILDITNESVAANAGLVPNVDYIVGSGVGLFHESDDFYDAVKNATEPLYVYNSKNDTFRYVYLAKQLADESIGCDVGVGYIHQIPINEDANPTTKLETNDITAKLSSTVETQPQVDIKVSQLQSPRAPTIQTNLPTISTPPVHPSPNLNAIMELMDDEKKHIEILKPN